MLAILFSMDRAFLNRIQADRGQIFSYLKRAWDAWFLHGIRDNLIQSPMFMKKFGYPAMAIINDVIMPERCLIICIYSPLLNNPRCHDQLPPPIPAQVRPAMR